MNARRIAGTRGRGRFRSSLVMKIKLAAVIFILGFISGWILDLIF
jgi:hypothetical protein